MTEQEARAKLERLCELQSEITSKQQVAISEHDWGSLTGAVVQTRLEERDALASELVAALAPQPRRYADLLASVGSQKDTWRSFATLQYTRALYAAMTKRYGSQKKFAEALNLTPARVSQILNGREDLTLESMADYAFALGTAVHIHLAPLNMPVQWVEHGDHETTASAGLTREEVIKLQALASGFVPPTGFDGLVVSYGQCRELCGAWLAQHAAEPAGGEVEKGDTNGTR